MGKPQHGGRSNSDTFNKKKNSANPGKIDKFFSFKILQ